MEPMVNVNKLRGKIRECDINVTELAARIGLTPSTLYRRLDGGCEKMHICEANAIAHELGLTAREAQEIFFAGIVADTRLVRGEIT